MLRNNETLHLLPQELVMTHTHSNNKWNKIELILMGIVITVGLIGWIFDKMR